MRRAEWNITVVVDDDGIATAQTKVGAGSLTLDGALVVGGVWKSYTGVKPDFGSKITLTSAGNDAGITFTFTGYDVDGKAQSETVAGTNGSTSTTTGYYSQITGITNSGATANTVKVGLAGANATRTYAMNIQSPSFKAALSATITGTANCTVQHTFDDVFASGWTAKTGTWQSNDDTALVAFTATVDGNYAYPPVATRLITNSASNGATARYVVIVPE